MEEKFQRKNGYEADCDVIYGDTDSVMVNFRVKDIARAMELGQEAAAHVSQTFIKPIKLEFEKVCASCDASRGSQLLCCTRLQWILGSLLVTKVHTGGTHGKAPVQPVHLREEAQRSPQWSCDRTPQRC